MSGITKFWPVRNVVGGGGTATAIQVGFTQVLGGNPDEIVYIGPTGLVQTDSLAVRSGLTTDTFIQKVNGISNQDYTLHLGDYSGSIGFDVAALIFFDNNTIADGSIGVTDASSIGGTPGVGGSIISTTDGVNRDATMLSIGDTGFNFGVNDAATLESAGLLLSLGIGSALSYTDGIFGSRGFISSAFGVSWGEFSVGTFELPLTLPAVGDVLGAPVAGGYGQCVWVPGSGSGVTIGGAVSGGTADEVLYTNSLVQTDSDPEFLRSDVDHSFLISSTLLSPGFVTAIASGSYATGLDLILANFDQPNNTGSFNRLEVNRQLISVTALNSPNNIGAFIDLDLSVPNKAMIGYVDAAANVTSFSQFNTTSANLTHRYNINTSSDNSVIVEASGVSMKSDIPIGADSVGFQIDWIAQTYGMGDLSNDVNGWGHLTSVTTRSFLGGDIGGQTSGYAFGVFDITQIAAIGDVPGNSSGNVLYMDGIQRLATHFSKHMVVVTGETFIGGGLDDATYGGDYVGQTAKTYTVTIDSTGTPDTFQWDDGGAPTTLVPITGAAQTLSDGVTIQFGATTGHTLTDSWTITLDNPQGAGLLLDYSLNAFGLGDMLDSWKKTKLVCDDENRTVFAYGDDGTNNALMLGVNADADINLMKTFIGWGALTNETTGQRNVSGGPGSSTAISDGDDNTFWGFASGGAGIQTGVSRNTGIGKEAGYNLGQDSTDNTMLGFKAKVNGTGKTGSIAVGSESFCNDSGQFVSGSNAFPIENYYFGGGIIDSGAGGYQVNLRFSNSGSGVDQQSSQIGILSGDTTGIRDGVLVVYMAKSGVTGSTVNSAAANEKLRINGDSININGGLVMAQNSPSSSPSFAYGSTFTTKRDVWHYWSDGTGSGATTINLSATSGQVFVISDSGGNSSTHAITIDSGSGNLIYVNGATPAQTYVLNQDYGSVTLHFFGGPGANDWMVI